MARQVDLARTFAATRSWQVTAEHIYIDDAVVESHLIQYFLIDRNERS